MPGLIIFQSMMHPTSTSMPSSAYAFHAKRSKLRQTNVQVRPDAAEIFHQRWKSVAEQSKTPPSTKRLMILVHRYITTMHQDCFTFHRKTSQERRPHANPAGLGPLLALRELSLLASMEDCRTLSSSCWPRPFSGSSWRRVASWRRAPERTAKTASVNRASWSRNNGIEA